MREIRLGNKTGLIHGGDYNPEQWLDCPEVLKEDIVFMKEAHINCVSLGIFSWVRLEPEDGSYDFKWLEEIVQRLYENGIYTILATPTGAMPPWLTAEYEEVMQMNEYGIRRLPGNRHNFCPSSSVMRRKMRRIDEELSKKLGRHPGVAAWHISNECGNNGGDASCHCPHCQEAFRRWLKERYGTLEALNRAWWTSFWSHTYTDWSQIHSPSERGENVLHGLKLDWKRFVSAQLLDFVKEEIHAVRLYSDRPVTTNMMGFFKPLNYFEWAKEMDIISWDCYPDWHGSPDEARTAADTAAAHSLMRSLKKAPFLMMESTPSVVNWRPYNALKRPGMHSLSSLQAVAHGSDSVQYFQWRKSRGSCEKFHGAVVDHRNGNQTRVFRDVKEVGERLRKISDSVTDTCNRAKIAIVFDWENWWAVEDAWAVQNKLDYQGLIRDYYKPFWDLGVDVDFIDETGCMEGYRIVVAPYAYLYREGYADRVRSFVENGGIYVTTCFSGEVNESDLCYTGSHPLADVLGIRTEELDAPAAFWKNSVEYEGKCYAVTGIRSLFQADAAAPQGYYQKDFYAGCPALTQNRYGSGWAWYIASQNEEGFLRDFYRNLMKEAGIAGRFEGALCEGVTVSVRKPTRDGGRELYFLQNFSNGAVSIALDGIWRNAETGELTENPITMSPFSCLILEEEYKA